MEGFEWLLDQGPLGLGLAAFIGATLVPVSSEIAVVAALELGMPAWQVLLSASIGNALGASLNYGMGWLLGPRVRQRLTASRTGRRALRWTEQSGKWSLLGSWLPAVGDPLCLAAGLFRINPAFFAAVGIGTRIMRYGVIILLLR